MKQRVLIFSTAYYPFVGGAEIAIKEITDRLGDEWEFELITAKLKPKLAKVERVGKVLVHRIGFGGKVDKLLLPFLGVMKIWQINRKSKVNIFWTVQVTYASGAAYLFNSLCFWKKDIPTVLTLQEGDSEEHLTKRHFGLIDWAWKIALPRSARVTALSNYLANRAKKYGAKTEPLVIPNGAADIFFEPRPGKIPGKVIVTVSRLVLKNGVDTLIEAMTLLPEYTLLIAGDGELRSDLEDQVSKLSLSDRIKFLGTVAQENLPELLSSADVFVRASRSEGLGISFIEAMAAGVPVIGTNVGGIPDFLTDGETGLFCEGGDSQSLAQKVRQLMGNLVLRDKIVKNARELAREKYTWDKIGGEMEKVFDVKAYYRITIASPSSPGTTSPTRYSNELSRELKFMGYEVKQMVFEVSLPPVLRHLYFAARLFISKSDFVIVLDNFSIALPAILSGKKIIIRLGGDFLWEHYANRTHSDVPLSRFYLDAKNLSAKERLIKFLSRMVYHRAAALVFSTDWQRQIFQIAYGLKQKKIFVIGNHVGLKEETKPSISKNFVWVGRDIPLKNLSRLERAIASAKEKIPEISLEIYKNIPQEKVWQKLHDCWAFILPSISEVSPNLVLQALGRGKPVIMTRECGYARWLGNTVMLVDPADEDDIAQAIIDMSRQETHDLYAKKAREFDHIHAYKEIAREFIDVLEKI